MTVRARLKYFDGNNNEVVIGSLDDDGGEGIQDLTLKNSAREYTKVIVSGGNGLFGKFPTDSGDSPDVTPQENAAGPEIFLEVFNQSTGVFEVRDRVFAESQGTVSDNGNFKHKRLYGFEKFVGRQNVDLTGADSVTTDIEQVLNDALPSGYVADVPTGATVPSVNDYRFKGRRDQVFKDLRENYNFIINFTAETDGSGNYLVKFEPRGFGGIVDTFEKGVDPVFFDKWTKGDELRRITRAEVIGTDSSGSKVSATASTNPDNGRFIRRNIGYVNSNAEAKDIAVNLIAADSDGGSPQSTEHGRVTAPIDRPATSNLNASIQIINDQINVDDSFTVVQQKDFFHQSQTQYSFEFEKELESRERRDKKDLGNRNSELITSVQEDVGSQSVSDNTDGQSVDLQRDQDVDADGSSTDFPKELRRDPNTEIFTDGGSSEIDSSQATETGVNGFAGSFAQLGSINATFSDGEGADMYFSVQVDYNGSNPNFAPTTVGVNHDFVLRDKTNGIDFPQSLITFQTRHTALDTSNDGNADFVTTETIEGVIHMPENPNGNEYELRAKPSVDVTYGSEIAFVQYDEHDHDDDIEIEDEDGNRKPDMVKSTTAEANITSQPKFTEDGQHVHTIDVTTEQDLIDLLGQDLVNR